MNEGTPLGVKSTISHKASVLYKGPNRGLYLYLLHLIYVYTRICAYRRAYTLEIFNTVNFTLEQAMKVQRGVEIIAVPFL
jgi:hypothetical protein